MKKFVFVILSFIIAGAVAYAADTYTPDPNHSAVTFTVTHLVISKVSGKFKDFTATVVYDPNDVTKSSLTGSIKTASISTDQENRDNDLKTNPGFFESDKYPEITFQSTKVYKKGEQVWIDGNLTIKGTTKPISFPVTVLGPITDAKGGSKIGVEATFTINRQDYGLTWNKKLDAGGAVVSDQVQININSELVKQQPQSKQ
jgi:polyisoprenoid-binding protein YceI